jgi:hypothetical protein
MTMNEATCTCSWCEKRPAVWVHLTGFFAERHVCDECRVKITADPTMETGRWVTHSTVLDHGWDEDEEEEDWPDAAH